MLISDCYIANPVQKINLLQKQLTPRMSNMKILLVLNAKNSVKVFVM